MKVKYLTTLFLLFSILLSAQKQANIWYFGVNSGLDFSNGDPIALTDGNLVTEEGCATISDENGNLLFYTDGSTVWNRNHTILLNGTGLLGHESSTNSAIIIPNPDNSSNYYIFTVDKEGNSNGFRYSELDMTLDSGLGGINTNKNIQLQNPVSEKLTAIKHPNKNEYWVLAHSISLNTFFSYKITELGIDLTPIISNTGKSLSYNGQGALKISPDGTKIAMCSSEFGVELFDFDVNTGVVSNAKVLLDSNLKYPLFYGVEFSSNSKVLYANRQRTGLFQFNLEAGSTTDIINSKVQIANFLGDGNFGTLQLGPDSKIYLARYSSKYLDVINNPNITGVNCNYENNAISLKGKESRYGLPPFIQSYFFITDIMYDGSCFGDNTIFSLTSTPDSVVWNFDDPLSGPNNTSNLIEPTHIFSKPGTYTISATVTRGVKIVTKKETITIYEIPMTTQPTNMIVCDTNNDGFFDFDLTTQGSAILNGQSSSFFKVEYFASMQNYIDNILIMNPSSYQNATPYNEHTIIAKVSNIQNDSCDSYTSFTIRVYDSPIPKTSSLISDLTICDNDSYGTDSDGIILFDLTQKADQILNGQSLSDFEITYYTDENFLNKITNPNQYQNTNQQEIVYCRIENKKLNSCSATTSFLIEVSQLPVINNLVSLKQCDDDTDGFSLFNLTEVNSKIVINPTNYTITYFEQKNDAEANNNSITNINAYKNKISSNDKIWARVENLNGCYRVSEVNLIVSTTQIPSSFKKEFFVCDTGVNSTDGIATFDFSSTTTEIKNIFPSNQQLIISYYANVADALSESNPILNISNYQNTSSPNQQIIYTRVDSAINNECLGLGPHIILNVDSFPIANPVILEPKCDTDRDGLFSFDTSTIQNTIIGGQPNVDVIYLDQNGNTLPSPLPNPFTTTSQKITARVTNTLSQDPLGKCFDETTLDFVVYSVPLANPITPQIVCDTDFDGIYSFDTSLIHSTIVGNQTNIKVSYFDDNGTPLSNPLPNPFTTATTNITVKLENLLQTTCSDETTVSFIVREKPSFELVEEEIICMNNSPKLELSIKNPIGNYSYQWTDENSIIVGNTYNFTAIKGGLYAVIATNEFGCTSEKKHINIIESKKAQLSTSALKIVEDSENNSIQINEENLGIGDYEFRLKDYNGSILIDYQNSPVFDNLIGGIYTIEINDKNGCGYITKDVSILSFPKFFTPNNDGVNDTWQVKGIGSKYFTEGRVSVFDRFGKNLVEFTIFERGWDGNYFGKKLPSNDYWFVIRLIDIKGVLRTRNGNFSLIRK